MKKTLVVTRRLPEEVESRISRDYHVRFNTADKLYTSDELIQFADGADGLLITGSASNVDPARYGGSPSDPGTLLDPRRDETNLALIPAAYLLSPARCMCPPLPQPNHAPNPTSDD